MSNLLININTGVVTEVEGCVLVNTARLDDEGLKLAKDIFLEEVPQSTLEAIRKKFGKTYGRPLQQVFDTLAEYGNSREENK